MAVRLFFILKDLYKMKGDGWMTNEHFEDFVLSLDDFFHDDA